MVSGLDKLIGPGVPKKYDSGFCDGNASKRPVSNDFN